MSDVPIRVVHEIQKSESTKPKKSKKPKEIDATPDDKQKIIQDLEQKLAEREAQLASLAFVEMDKKRDELIDRFPEMASRIERAESIKDLMQLEAKLNEDFEPYQPKPKGKATLPQTIDNPLDRGQDEGSLINKLYREQKRPKSDYKQEARKRTDKLFADLSNISLDHMTRVMRNVSPHYICPSCGAVTSADLSRKGGTCTVCGHEVGKHPRIEKR
jgi:hypothetical protein